MQGKGFERLEHPLIGYECDYFDFHSPWILQ